jgi:dolichol-phosphate mannosyltransferase
LFMADGSDQPDDLIRCYRVMQDGWDCVFGSRFMRGSHTTHYPWLKLAINRLVNQTIRMMFWTSHNDMTNAFKLYRKHVIQACQPLRACHFNITIELSLGALIRGYSIARIPISWHGRTWGSTHLKLRDMGRRYLHTLLVMYSTRALVLDDIVVADERPQTPQKDPE